MRTLSGRTRLHRLVSRLNAQASDTASRDYRADLANVKSRSIAVKRMARRYIVNNTARYRAISVFKDIVTAEMNGESVAIERTKALYFTVFCGIQQGGLAKNAR